MRLDLHGVKHQDVPLLVENFILSNQSSFPLTVICGNSVPMIKLVENELKRLNCEFSMYRFGILTVGKFK